MISFSFLDLIWLSWLINLLSNENMYTDGKQEVFKEKVVVDEEKNTLALIGLEGDVMTTYKVFNPTYHLTPKGDGSLARLIIEYEKLDENIPVPDKYMDFMITVTRDIDANLTKA